MSRRRIGSARALSVVVAVEGAVMVAVGAVAWLVTRRELANAHITVDDDADLLAGRRVTGPLSAYAEARVIEKHALAATGGKAFAELPGEDPHREMAKTASFMQASLFTSVMAFGVSALAVASGLALLVLARAVRALAKR